MTIKLETFIEAKGGVIDMGLDANDPDKKGWDLFGTMVGSIEAFGPGTVFIPSAESTADSQLETSDPLNGFNAAVAWEGLRNLLGMTNIPGMLNRNQEAAVLEYLTAIAGSNVTTGEHVEIEDTNHRTQPDAVQDEVTPTVDVFDPETDAIFKMPITQFDAAKTTVLIGRRG